MMKAAVPLRPRLYGGQVQQMVLLSPAVNKSCSSGTPYRDIDLNYLAIVLAELGVAATVKGTMSQ